MSICVYQGSFNPIHNAHLKVAEYVHSKFNFETITFIPAFIPPHKDLNGFDSRNAIHRLNMVELALEDIPYFNFSAIEYTRNKPSYTYDTIVQIKEITGTNEKINFIIGTDAFKHIESWYRAIELKELLNFILFIREDNFNEESFIPLKQKGFCYDLMDMPFCDISATEVRERIRQDKDICDILPVKVAEYIKKYNVYKI